MPSQRHHPTDRNTQTAPSRSGFRTECMGSVSGPLRAERDLVVFVADSVRLIIRIYDSTPHAESETTYKTTEATPGGVESNENPRPHSSASTRKRSVAVVEWTGPDRWADLRTTDRCRDDAGGI